MNKFTLNPQNSSAMTSSESQFPFDITMKTAYVDDSEGVAEMVTKIDFYPKNSDSRHKNSYTKPTEQSHSHKKIIKKRKHHEAKEEKPTVKSANINPSSTNKPNIDRNMQYQNQIGINSSSTFQNSEISSSEYNQEELLNRLDGIIQKIRHTGLQNRLETKGPVINTTQREHLNHLPKINSQKIQANLSDSYSYTSNAQSEQSQEYYDNYYSTSMESDGSFQDQILTNKKKYHRHHGNHKKKVIRRSHRRKVSNSNSESNDYVEMIDKKTITIDHQADKQCQTLISGESLSFQEKSFQLTIERENKQKDEEEPEE